MKYIIGLLLVGVIGFWTSHIVEAGNTTVGLTILGSGDNNSGNNNPPPPPPPPPPEGGGGGGGGGGGESPPVGNGSNNNEIPFISPISGQDLLNFTGQQILPTTTGQQQTTTSLFDDELIQAYKFAKNNNITNASTIELARMFEPIKRGEIAKMLVEYTKSIKKQKIVSKQLCYTPYKDVNSKMWEYPYVHDICSLAIMGWRNDLSERLPYFRPADILSRAEFGTLLSRYLYGAKYMGGNSNNYYEKHLDALKKAGLLKKIDNPTMIELRGNVFIVLYRLSK